MVSSFETRMGNEFCGHVSMIAKALSSLASRSNLVTAISTGGKVTINKNSISSVAARSDNRCTVSMSNSDSFVIEEPYDEFIKKI